MLVELNEFCGADRLTQDAAVRCLTEFEGPLYGLEMGICYGGGVQKIGLAWKERGTVWGFDTFEGHPQEEMIERCEATKQAAQVMEDVHTITCMERWYNDPEYGREKFTYDYIRKGLDELGLSNVHLVKGLVTDQTDISFIPKLHYVFLDMDYPQAQWDGYNLVKNLIVPGGYLCLHDMVRPNHMPGNYDMYQKMLAEGLFDIVTESDPAITAVLKKK
jgi:hypothetical protein